MLVFNVNMEHIVTQERCNEVIFKRNWKREKRRIGELGKHPLSPAASLLFPDSVRGVIELQGSSDHSVEKDAGLSLEQAPSST